MTSLGAPASRRRPAVPGYAFCLAAALFALTHAHADDSSAVLGAGGLVLTHSAAIRMAAEDLRISPKDVSARFRFVNDGKTDVDIIVAFPLPDIDTSRFSEEPLGSTTNNPLNFVGFEVSENGRKVPFETEQRAFYKGRDVTEIVRRAGVPLNIVDPAFTKTLEALSPAKRRLLESADLADHESGSYEHPHWTVRTRFWWRERFRAGQTVTLDEHYHPVTGQSLFGAEELKPANDDARFWAKTYCIDPGTRDAIAAMLARNPSSPQKGNYLTASTTDYVLKTGANWAGLIGRFRLVLDKLSARNLVSLCWDGRLAKTGPSTYESARENFAPKSDIRLLVLQQAAP